MYRELIGDLAKENNWVKIQPPCPVEEIRRAEQVAGYPFPKELRELLQEANGDHYCLLSAQEIIENVERNREILFPLFEEDYSKEKYIELVDRFIFFATNGCGDYYCYRVTEDGIPDETAIYIWEHESLGEKCWKKVAGNMEEFISRYYKGEI